MEPIARTLAVLADLIAFDTTSALSNLRLIEHVRASLEESGVAADVVFSPGGDKANLWATIGPMVDGGVVLSGHSDVVPVAGQRWSSDPFALDLRDGRAYGRGTADMKGFIACVLAAVPALVAADLRRPVHIAITYDEEVGCVGAPVLLAWLAHRTPRPAIAIVGEPTDMRVVNAHKGILVARTEIDGVEAHSSLAHLGVSAVGLAGAAIALIRDVESDLAHSHRDARFVPEHTTLSVNRIAGGTAVNILAGHAAFDWDIRPIAGVDARDVLARVEARIEDEVVAPVRARFPTVAARTTVAADAPALSPDGDALAERLAKRLLGTNEAHAVPFAAEAGQFQQAGLSTVIVGPGSIEQAHTADEYVTLDQLARCERFLDRLRLDLCS